MVLIKVISLISFSFSTSISFSSSSCTLVALLSRNALCAARFCAFLFEAGISTLGFLPGFGLGGKTHSLDVIISVTGFDIFIAVAVAVVAVAAGVLPEEGVVVLMVMEGCREFGGLLAEKERGVDPAEIDDDDEDEDGDDPAIAIGEWAVAALDTVWALEETGPDAGKEFVLILV